MRIDITVIDMRDINKNEQVHPKDEPAHKYDEIVVFSAKKGAVGMS